MMRVFLLMLLLLAPGLQAATHTYEVRMAGYAQGQADQKGAATYGKFVHAFRSFPWAEQVGKAQEGAEPSIKVLSTAQDGASLFVSVIGQPTAMGFVVGVIYPKTLEGAEASEVATGDAGKSEKDSAETVRWAEVFVVKSPKLVERYAQKYFTGDIDALLEFMRKAPPFLSGEASLIPNLGE